MYNPTRKSEHDPAALYTTYRHITTHTGNYVLLLPLVVLVLLVFYVLVLLRAFLFVLASKCFLRCVLEAGYRLLYPSLPHHSLHLFFDVNVVHPLKVTTSLARCALGGLPGLGMSSVVPWVPVVSSTSIPNSTGRQSFVAICTLSFRFVSYKAV